MSDVEQFLEHYGVKGMKWGVITKGRSSRAPKKLSSDHKRAKKIREKSAPELTNKQINFANNRVTLEQSYKRLNPGKIERGNNQVKALLGIAGTATAVYTLSKSPAGQAAMQAGKKFLKSK